MDRDGTVARSGSILFPVFKILPGRYIAELPPSTALPPTAVQVSALRLSCSLTMACSDVEVTRIRPFGKT